MIKVKLLITAGLLVLLIPFLDKGLNFRNNQGIRQNQDPISHSQRQIIQFIQPAEASVEDTPSENGIDTDKQRNLGFCLNVPILMYHHIQPQNIAQEKFQTALSVDTGVFENQMAYLKDSGYQTISLDRLAQALIENQQLGRVVALTFDDGYRDFYTWAYPIIQKYSFVANLFISTGLVENPDYLTWQELKQMVSGNQVFAYNHTWSHANLAGSSQSKMESEITTAQRQLTDYLGVNPKIFAYPYGGVSQAAIDILKQNNFTAAFSTIQGKTQCDSFLMSLHRTRIGNSPLSAYGI